MKSRDTLSNRCDRPQCDHGFVIRVDQPVYHPTLENGPASALRAQSSTRDGDTSGMLLGSPIPICIKVSSQLTWALILSGLIAHVKHCKS